MAHFRIPYIAGNGLNRDHVYPALGTPSQVNEAIGITDLALIADEDPYFGLENTLAVLWRISGYHFVSGFSANLVVEGTPDTEDEFHNASALIDMSAPDAAHSPPNTFIPYYDGSGNPDPAFETRVIAGARKWSVFGTDADPKYHFIPSGLQPPGKVLEASTGQTTGVTYTVAGNHNAIPYASTLDDSSSGTFLIFLRDVGITNAQGSSVASLAIFDPTLGANKFFPFPSFASAVAWNIQLLGFSRQARAFVSGPIKTPVSSEGFFVDQEGFNVYRIRYPVDVVLDPVIAPPITFKAQGEMVFTTFGFIPTNEVTLLNAAAAGSLAITANKFVPFTNSQNLPIYDEASGAQLRDPLS